MVYCHFWDFNAHFIGAQLHYSIKTTEKYGGSNYGKYGGFIGTTRFIFPTTWFSCWHVTRRFLRRTLHDRNDKQKALKATKGAFIGFIYGTGF
ncbi:MAG: DUF456 domain-containing protein [Cloacibacterium normanense]